MREKISSIIETSIQLKKKMISDEQMMKSIQEVVELCVQVVMDGNKLIFAGNGGSAADAQHIAAEFVGRFGVDRRALPALALTTDTSTLTCISNDYGFEYIFSRQLEALGRSGDAFIAISTSGNSNNLLKAVEYANQHHISTVSLSGDGGRLSELCQFAIRVPASSTPRIQEGHCMIGHILAELIEAKIISPVRAVD